VNSIEKRNAHSGGSQRKV